MRQINPKKLLGSKWTAIKSVNKEKHFLVTDIVFDEDEKVELCVLEAIISHREVEIDWLILKDNSQWLQGWK